MIIGISGVATSGKDTFAKIAKEILEKDCPKSCKIFHFADELKKDLAPFIQEKLGLDVFRLTPEQKTAIRPLLVWYGCFMRQMDENYWVKKVAESIGEQRFTKYFLIPDVRFENEARWIHDNSGKLFHVERFDGKHVILPANETEFVNDPIVKKLSDEKISWNTVNWTEDHKSDELYQLVKKALGK